MADLSVIKLPDNNIYNLKDGVARSKLNYLNIAYAICSDAGSVQTKTASVLGEGAFALNVGAIVGIRYANDNTYNSTASNFITMNVGGTGATPFLYGATVKPTGTNPVVYGISNNIHFYMYDGTNYVYLGRSEDSGNTYTTAVCSTASSSASKTAIFHDYIALPDSYLHILMTTNNTAADALTLNINGQGDKPIYINGTISSNTNYALPAGAYIIYYDGDNYYFRTDGQLTMPDIIQDEIDAIFGL